MKSRRGALRWLALVPVAALLVAPFVANRVTPYILGLPFFLAWVVAWVALTSVGMGVLYRADRRARGSDGA